MRNLAPGLWIVDSPLRFVGLEIGARMTVVRLADGTLLLHSPVAANEDVLTSVQALGDVSAIIAPNKFHHLFVADWQRAFPHAALHVAPGIEKKRPDLAITSLIGDAPLPRLGDVLDHVVLRGIPATNEAVFFHRPSGTLVGTDLAFHIDATSPPLTRGVFKLGGTFGRLAPTLVERVFIRDRGAFRDSLKRILEWPFERVVVAHGAVSESSGRADLERGYGWLLEGR